MGAVVGLDGAQAIAWARAYLSAGGDRQALVEQLALAACRIGNDPHNQEIAQCLLEDYNKNRGFYRFRWFYDYSGGQLTNFGVHYLAQIQASLGVEAPKAVVAIGGKFANYDNREVPDTMEVERSGTVRR